LKIGAFEGVGQFWPNFHIEGDATHESFLHGEID